MTERENDREGRERAADESRPTGAELDAQLAAEDRPQTEAATKDEPGTLPKVGKNQVGRKGGTPLH